MKKELPIAFSDLMVPPIMDGTKTMTRRIITEGTVRMVSINRKLLDFDRIYPNGTFGIKVAQKYDPSILWRCAPQYATGDRLWVREPYYAYGYWKPNGVTEHGRQKYAFVECSYDGPNIRYANDRPEKVLKNSDRTKGWYARLGRFMPKAHARIWLEVTDVKAEKLQDISLMDARKEGIQRSADFIHWKSYEEDEQPFCHTEIGSFKSLWEHIHGKDTWKANPWLWAYTFKLISTTGKP